MNTNNLQLITKQIRHNIIRSTTAAGTGHPTSSLSGVEFMTALMFDGHFRAILDEPMNINNDRLIFSKGHACPLLYSLYYTAGHLSEKALMSLRKFGSNIEGHPTMNWQYTEAATGSLGQGLGVASGLALGLKATFGSAPAPKVYCVLGDSEMAEGSIWEAMNSSVYNNLDNLIGIVDMNRLGQRGQTQIGHDTANLKAKCEAFGWETYVIEEGNNLEACLTVFNELKESKSNKMDGMAKHYHKQIVTKHWLKLEK
jgi:transketolase